MHLKIIQNVIDVIRGKKKVKNPFEKYIDEKKCKLEQQKILNDKSLDIEIPDDLTLQVGFNDNCNCKCKFCCLGKPSEIKPTVIPEDLIYQYLLPLYPKTKVLMPTYAELAVAKGGYEYIDYLNKNYPAMNINLETNGIAFTEKWQKLAIECLSNVNFSVNASNRDDYAKTVWDGDNGEVVFDKVINNLTSYLDLLKENNLSVFAPSISMVLTKQVYDKVLDFVKMALSLRIFKIGFLFDNVENDLWNLDNDCSDQVQQVIKVLLEIDRILKGRVAFSFKWFMPANNISELEKDVESIPIEVLKEKYKEIDELSKDRNIMNEYNERTRIRTQKNKKILTLHDDIVAPTYHQREYDGHQICANPWNHLRFDILGNINLCCCRGKYDRKFHYKSFIKNGKLDWNDVFNGYYYKKTRQDFMAGDYDGCLRNCPGTNIHPSINTELFVEHQ